MTVLCLICDFLPVASDIDILAVPGVCDVKGIVFCHPQPVLFAFLTEVALNDEMLFKEWFLGLDGERDKWQNKTRRLIRDDKYDDI